MNAAVTRVILARGADVFYVERYGLVTTEEEWEAVRTRPPVTAEDAEAIRREAPSAAHVLTTWNFRATLRAGRHTAETVQIEAHTAEYPFFLDETLDAGRHFTEGEERRGASVAVLGSEVAEALFPGESALGRGVKISGREFEVIGVMRSRGALLGQSQDRYACVPLGAAVTRFRRPWDVRIAVKPVAPELLDEAADEARVAIRARRGLRPAQPDPFDLLAAATYLKLYRRLTGAIYGALVGLVGLALVVGGIVIANVMLMVVAQRTREIGIRKAVGATRGQVLAQFLVESATLSLGGGAVGFALGAAATWALGKATPVPFAIEPWSVAAGFALVLVVGVLAGLYPASRAARMSPINALQYER
jgi:putative ABC transport system permease protein